MPPEQERLEDVHALDILDTPSEERFDAITETARLVFDVPIALVTLVDRDRQWFKSCMGLDVRETPRAVSFCSRAIEQDDLFIVPDAAKDPRFQDNALVTGPPHIRFYAGQAVHGPHGHRVGTLCIIDRRPRRLSQKQKDILARLAGWLQRELDARTIERMQERLGAQRRMAAERDAIIDAIPDHLALLDADGRIIAVNQRWRRFAKENGGDEDAYLGTSYLSAAEGDETADAAAEGVREVLAGRRERFSLEYPCHSPTQERWFILAVTRVVAGRIRAVTTHTDITARVVGERRRAREIRDAEEKERLRQDAALRRQLLNIVGHQISTPLTPMRVHISTLRRQAPEDHRLQAIQRNIDRLERLRQGLEHALEISAVRGLDASPTAWGPFWQAAAQELAQELGIEDRVRIHASGDAAVHLDPRWCRRLLHELLENAATFAPEGPVDVIARLGRKAELRVQDQGPGLPEEDAKGIFRPFSESSTVHTDAGAGLGLFIVQRIARLHGGHVRHEAASPGSQWIVSLPRRRNRAAVEDAGEERRDPVHPQARS